MPSAQRNAVGAHIVHSLVRTHIGRGGWAHIDRRHAADNVGGRGRVEVASSYVLLSAAKGGAAVGVTNKPCARVEDRAWIGSERGCAERALWCLHKVDNDFTKKCLLLVQRRTDEYGIK